MRHILIFTAMILLSGSVLCQSKWLNKADEAKSTHNYFKAVKYYMGAYETTTDPVDKLKIQKLIIDAYLEMNLYLDALNWAEKLCSQEKSAVNIIQYTEILSKSGRISQAVEVLQNSLLDYPEDDKLPGKYNSLLRYKTQMQHRNHNNIQRVEELNSDYSDYSAVNFMNRQIIFSSTRIKDGLGLIDGRTSHGYSDLYSSKYNPETKSWEKPRQIQGKINSKKNEGTFSFDSLNNIGYTMQCNEKTSNCMIIRSAYETVSGSWQNPTPISLNSKTSSLGHPFINEQGSILYFVSDMEGGYGGKDIWLANKKEDGSWGLPVNLGNRVNTAYDELFPFVCGDTLLFYASNAPEGYGGLDILYSIKKDYEFAEGINPGYPFNSPSDDFALSVNKNLKGGFFTSDRIAETSDDIYSFSSFPFAIAIEGIVEEIVAKTPIPHACVIFNAPGFTDTVFTDQNGKYYYAGFLPYTDYQVTAAKEEFYPEKRTLCIADKDFIFTSNPVYTLNFSLAAKQYPVAIKGKVTERGTGQLMPGEKLTITGSNNFNSFTYTGDNGMYNFYDLKPENMYLVKISKEGYFSESRECNIPKVNEPMQFSKETGYDMDFELTKIEKKKEIVLNNIYYDFDKATLRPESMEELNKLASMLKETPEVTVQISSHTDSRGDGNYNLKLSDRRAQAVVDYLIKQGTDKQRLIAKGYGEGNLLVPNAKTEEQHQQNRRTTFRVTDVVETGKPVRNEIIKTDKTTSVTFRVQIHSTQQPIAGNRLFHEITGEIQNTHVFVHEENGFYKYEIGERYSLEEAGILKNKLKEMGYTGCFITAWYNGAKISIARAKQYTEEL